MKNINLEKSGKDLVLLNLKNLLKEIFSINYPDLDFGIYRIAKFRQKEIENYIDNELENRIQNIVKNNSTIMEQIEEIKNLLKEELDDYEAFKKYTSLESFNKLQEQYEDEILENYGKKGGKKILDLLQQYYNLKNTNNFSAPENIYNRLYDFFDRYYQDGDFVKNKKRYGLYDIDNCFKKEDCKAENNCFECIPYKVEGGDTTFTWATYGQYYIKTGKNYNLYRFKIDGLNLGKELEIRFEIKQDEEKLDENKKIVLDFDSLDFIYEGKNIKEVVIYFKKVVQDKNNKLKDEEIIDKIKKAISKIKDKDLKNVLLKQLFEEKVKEEHKTNTITYHFNKFKAESKDDFFIHKNLKGFLNDELEKYITYKLTKDNQEDLFNNPELFSTFAQKIKIFKEIAQDIISFIADLEDFQKRLWEKKKFIYNQEYVITFDKLENYLNQENYEDLLKDVYENKTQQQEWIDLGMIKKLDYNNFDEFKDFIKQHNKLPIDTKHFRNEKADNLLKQNSFKNKLLSYLSKNNDIEEILNGELFKSDNFQALNLIQDKYKERIKTIYIDPPYNTGGDGFVYKDNFKHSSWLSMMENRLLLAKQLMKEDGVIFTSIDDNELDNLKKLEDMVFGGENFVGNFIWQKNFAPKNDNKYISISHEYITLYSKQIKKFNRNLLPREEKHNKDYKNPDNDPRGPWTSGTMLATTFSKQGVFEIISPTGKVHLPPKGRCWRFSKEKVDELIKDNRIWFGKDGNNVPRIKRFLSEMPKGVVPQSWLPYQEAGSGQDGTQYTKALFNFIVFNFPKPIKLIRTFNLISSTPISYILDFFAGSGTTADAVIRLNQEDGGNRKFILTEINYYFDTIIIPRIKKVAYSFDWKNGKPQDGKENTGPGIFFRYSYLEQYEDTLNNLPEPKKLTDDKLGLFHNDLEKFIFELNNNPEELKNKEKVIQEPFTQTMKIGNNENQILDIVETFNYLLGIDLVEKIVDENNKEIIVIGKKNNKYYLIIWQQNANQARVNENFDKYREKYADKGGIKEIFVNKPDIIQPENSLDKPKYIFNEFYKRMFN